MSTVAYDWDLISNASAIFSLDRWSSSQCAIMLKTAGGSLSGLQVQGTLDPINKTDPVDVVWFDLWGYSQQAPDTINTFDDSTVDQLGFISPVHMPLEAIQIISNGDVSTGRLIQADHS